ncbi:MAG: hypothetical protein ACLSV2_08225 [Clostridium sp.]
MILYHGTSEKRGIKIFDEMSLKTNALRVYGEEHLLPTTGGYIYLTNNLVNAIYYGNKTACEDEDNYLFVFEIEIDECKLEADMDQIIYSLIPFGKHTKIKDIDSPTVQESLAYALSVRTRKDIDIKTSKTRFSKIVSSICYEDTSKRRNTQKLVGLLRSCNNLDVKFRDDFIRDISWKGMSK